MPEIKTKSKKTHNRVLVVGTLLIVAMIVYLLIGAVQGATVYYITVSELYEQGAAMYDKPVRISGRMVKGTSGYDAVNIKLSFEITDDSSAQPLPVIYNDVPPDMFNNAKEIVVEGRFTAAGIFEADKLMLKCPSKYEMQEEEM